MPSAPEDSNVTFSAVIPLYNEEPSLEELHIRLTHILAPLSERFELIFIDDGSTDHSYTVLKNLHHQDSRVKVVCFRRNFGKAAALSAGFKKARGDIVITLDADLQDLPEEIPSLLKKMEEMETFRRRSPSG